MPWVAFDRDYLWRASHYKGRIATQFKKGTVFFVPREAADEMISRQAAREATPEEIEHARGR